MRTFYKRALWGTLIAGGITLLGATAANAADNTTSGQDGILSGTQALVSVSAPITVSGNSVSLLGHSTATSPAPAAPAPAPAASAGTTGSGGVGSGGSDGQFLLPEPVVLRGRSGGGHGRRRGAGQPP